MSSGTAFKEQIKKVRREIQLSCDSKSLLRALKDTQRCLEGLAGEPNYKLCVAHLVKELVDWVGLKEDRDWETAAGKACRSLFEEFLHACHDAEKTTRCFLVARLYNAFVALNRKDSCRWTKLHIARLMSLFAIEDEQADLYARVKRAVLKTVHEMAKSANAEEIEHGADLLIEMQRKLLVHEAGKPRTADGIRQSALDLFREVFDNGMAILCRLHSVSLAKAKQLYQTIMDTMLNIVKPDEQELISLLGDTVGYLETILAYAVGDNANYCQFAGFLAIFEAIRSEPYANCYTLIRLSVKLVKQEQPTARQLEEIAATVRALLATFPSHQLVVRVAIFLTCQSIPHLCRLPQELALNVSQSVISLFEALLHFVRHCPSDTVPEICRACTSSRRHLADKLLSMLMHFNIVQARDAADQKPYEGKLSYSVSRGCDLIKRKLTLLEELVCERKRSLIESSMRYSVSWLKYVIMLQCKQEAQVAEEVEEIVQMLKLIIGVQNRYRFEFLSDMHLVRLLDSTYTDQAGSNASASCWPNVSVRLLRLLLTLRDSSAAAASSEEHTASVSAIVRSIMCYQVNAPETDPIRSLTVLQLYEHPSFDRFGFAFDCVPTRAEQFTILAEEMALVSKYKTSNSLPVWEYMEQLAQVGDIREHCLTFGMALHGFSENDAAKLPESMMDTLLDALKQYRPANALERVKRCASLAIVSYHTFTLAGRSTLNRWRDIPFKVEQLRNGQIDEILLENQLDREAQLVGRLEAIRKHYGELMAALEADNFQSLWVLPSIAQISSILDNTARLYHLNYHPHRAVELQLLNLLLVSQRRDVRPLDQCASLAFLLEQHQLADVQLKERRRNNPNAVQKHAGGSLELVEYLAKRATTLLHPPGSIDDVPANRKFQLLNLYLALAVYLASVGELAPALRLIQRALDHVNQSTNVDTIAQLFQGRTAQILFRLTVEHGLPWPESVPPLAFMKRMLASFNDLQKISSEHTFTLSLATVEMTIEVLQHLIVRYDTGPLVEPHVEQLLKFVMRRGAGLRVMQLLLLYGQMCADMQKLDRCEVILGYLDRLLMLRPILSAENREKGMLMDHVTLAGDGGHHKAINSAPLGTQSVVQDLVDVEREAAPKNRIIPKIAALGEAIGNETVVEQYLMFHHAPGCDCRYCSYPQYKSMAFQTAALAVRLAVLQRTQPTNYIERSYATLCEHWRTQIHPNSVRHWNVPAYRTDLTVTMIRTLLQRGQFLVRQEHYEAAREAYRWASELTVPGTDPALSADVRYNANALAMLMHRPVRTKRSRSMIEARYTELLARLGKASSGSSSPDMALLTTNLSNLMVKTPKSDPIAYSGRTAAARAPPKTVDRVNELIRQAASRRHQLKTSGPDALLVPDGTIPSRTYSASARKPKTVNIFVDSPLNRPGRANAVPTTVGKAIKPTGTKLKSKALEPELADPMEEGCESSKDAKLPESSRRGEKREMANLPRPETDPVTPKRATDSYKDALLIGTPASTLVSTRPNKTGNKTAGRKVRRLVVEDFPSLSESSDTDASTKTPRATTHKPSTSDSPALNGSFRDVLVLGDAAKKHDSSVVIVLDDSANDSGRQSDEAIETSFDHSHAVSADKRTGLSLKTYSDRKRLLGSGGGPLSASSSSAARLAAAKRRTPLLATKTKLRFDDPSPERIVCGGGNDGVKKQHQAETTVVVVSELDGKKQIIANIAKDTALDEKSNGRSRTKKVMDPPVPTSIEPAKVEPRMSTIASRTRQRRKRI
uniref:Separase n=1 Tax=Anopheles quadriannulatus TaxID=34691 RepID=A0A182XBH0_ANOQN